MINSSAFTVFFLQEREQLEQQMVVRFFSVIKKNREIRKVLPQGNKSPVPFLRRILKGALINENAIVRSHVEAW